MKKLIRIVVFLAVFVVSTLVIAELIKQDGITTASDLGDPTLPVMYLDIDGTKADRMYGYQEEMTPSDMRDVLIPVATGRELSIAYKSYGNEIRSVSYEITAPDTGAVVGNAQIGNFKQDGEYMTASFTLNASFLMNREYPVCFTLETPKGNIYYYARLIQRSVNRAADYVTFVNNFCETCLNKEAASDLSVYLETDESKTSVNYSSISLKSSVDQVSWGSLSPSFLRRGIPAIREINDNTCSLTNEYLLSCVNEEGKTEVYHVSEFYRLRYTSTRMRLLDFKRSVQQVFDPDKTTAMTARGILLGITPDPSEYAANEDASAVAFVQGGDLWLYSDEAEKLTRVFTFHNDTSEGDERNDHTDYEIRLMSVSGKGDIDFVVAGYLNQGIYEGRSGILVCRYDSGTGVVEERAFIPDSRSADRLMGDLDRLNAISGDTYYAYLHDSICQVNLTDKICEIVTGNIEPDCFASAADNSAAAWMDDMEKDASSSISVLNTATGQLRHITAESGTYLKVLGFINGDLVYGVANASDLQQDTAGNTIFAMKKLVIEKTDGTEVLTYEKEGIYVTAVSIENGLIDMTRMVKDERGNYIETTTDNILNNQESSQPVSISSASTSRTGKMMVLVLPQTVSNMKPLVTRAALHQGSGDIELLPEYPEPEGERYYVYAGGSLLEVAAEAKQAVLDADENAGVALNKEGQYLYERGNTPDDYEIANEDIPEAFKSTAMNAERLREELKDEGEVLEMSGCTLSEMLYEVGQGRPVLARRSDGSTALIVGYNNYNTRLYNFETGEHYWFGINDSTEDFAGGGNVFIVFVPEDKTVRE